ncbi:transglutaminase-like domain-containing protein [Croceitalea rosinachiae]|uniref:Transglutaminase family protein n=1 Tax=Croceitalea rosinachiae TaxID=3075596 RepID=A0ABU3AB25_9FLAO|nr:transglutaminase family protein [Croceitalea sp. F388]MDT0607388.1 transglutaminase family protein [Croceitalea sp. F388]
MSLKYEIVYKAKNTYENTISEAFWQFLIVPEENETQELVESEFNDSHETINELSINGLGFKVIRIRPRKEINTISFSARFVIFKQNINPYDFKLNYSPSDDYEEIQKLDFQSEHEPYLRKTVLTKLPEKYKSIYVFYPLTSVFENLKSLTNWVFNKLFFKTGVTDVHTTLQEIIEKRHGVCQDFTHLFCAICRENSIPARYVSGYLHQGNGYFGDSQMHAWAEAFVPNVGWIGFDPTNDILADSNHIKVSHGKDYNDCSPLKGIVYGEGGNETTYTVEVQASQQQ